MSVIEDDNKMNFASHFSELTYLASQVVIQGLTSNDAYQFASKSTHETIKMLLRLILNVGAQSREQSKGNGNGVESDWKEMVKKWSQPQPKLLRMSLVKLEWKEGPREID